MNLYQVIVGNIGTVEDTDSIVKANATFREYVEQSQSNVGRAGGEDVTLLRDGEPTREYFGSAQS